MGYSRTAAANTRSEISSSSGFWETYNQAVSRRLTTITAKELAAQSKGYAIASQAPSDCEEIAYFPGPPTLVHYRDRRTGKIRVFKFTFQWQLVEVGVEKDSIRKQ